MFPLGFKKAGKALVKVKEGKMVVEPVRDFLRAMTIDNRGSQVYNMES